MNTFNEKPSPQEVLENLLQGNNRFIEGKPNHPHVNVERRKLASCASQANFAVATVLSCSDSRVPPEIIFDCGIMDLFVVRLAGNVLSECALASIEYGVIHVNTPLLLVIAHSQCGAITAVVDEFLKSNDGSPPKNQSEPNIQKLLNLLAPTVNETCKCNNNLPKEELVNLSAKGNAKNIVEQILKLSPGIRELHNNGTIKIVPTFYELETGRVHLI
ncbi:MAG: carbonic anhydrase [Candidatus Hydrogenedentes bacterium]|nr:carbonic anhydrase [Candidatus Hydrogenedentota bacterium]